MLVDRHGAGAGNGAARGCGGGLTFLPRTGLRADLGAGAGQPVVARFDAPLSPLEVLAARRLGCPLGIKLIENLTDPCAAGLGVCKLGR